MSSAFGYEKTAEPVGNALVGVESTFREDKKHAYGGAIKHEKNEEAGWVLEAILKNVEATERNHNPPYDDAGIPHLVLEVGPDVFVTGRTLDTIRDGIASGLRELPGRPMGVMGDDSRRIGQSGGLDPSPADVGPAPILLGTCGDNVVRLHIMMLDGRPAIRARTYRVFHRHNTQMVIGEIVKWVTEGVARLGCSPYTLAVGIGRSHSEAASMVLQAQADGCYDVQPEMEVEITRRVNGSDIGSLGLHGRTSVIATFVKTGPQRAGGVRTVCVGPACCFEPRIATVGLIQ